MLHKIYNKQNDFNLDTFSKAVIYLAKDFSFFDRFTSNEDLNNILSNINTAATVLFLNLLPENVSVSSSSKIVTGSTLFNNSIGCKVTPQTEDIQSALSKFNNKEVFICLQKEDSQHLYGTTKEPLLFTFSELNSFKPGTVQGYSISISGSTIEKTRFVNINDFNIVSRLLSSPLASGL
ncbi:hypothetical protein Leef1_40 [Polaribacter phage Leef_1]|uniref:Uncharacterized protein n=1 Tax=Polaribacter phage Leef_1 TaxID=2745684 RepID=A0A8E5EBJ6_9CAUD|nr:hypothetical protein M1M28_gp40 [Polaribacter phage Leef_1]QQV91406.1 hypothetical protein Leef1_40 [Polaribacter phage Leef_1]